MVSTSGVPNHPGCIAAIWRYPVKSMMGEELDVAAVTERGLFGDRAFALIDSESGKVISTDPRKWGDLFAFRAGFPESTHQPGPLPRTQVTFPDGSSATSAEPDIDARLSDRLGRSVRLTASVPEAARAEGYWPDYHWLEQPDAAFDFQMPPGTFFDGAPIHLVTTATLHQLALLAPKSRFDVPRFRPNFVIDCADSPRDSSRTTGSVVRSRSVARFDCSLKPHSSVMTTFQRTSQTVFLRPFRKNRISHRAAQSVTAYIMMLTSSRPT